MKPDDGNSVADAPQRPGESDAVRSGTRIPDTACGSLFDDVFAGPGAVATASVGSAPPTAAETASRRPRVVPPPESPGSLEASGLTLGQIGELILKQLYLENGLQGADFARATRLPFSIIDEGLRALKEQRCIEVAAGGAVGRASHRFSLTELGRLRAREVFDACRYVGPAPVPLEQYIAQCRLQSVHGTNCTAASLSNAFRGVVIGSELLEELGTALCSGCSIFVYGPPGNGKTLIAKRLGRYLNTYGGEIYVPYAIQIDNSIITVFDPVLHQTCDDAELARRGLLPSHPLSPATPPIGEGTIDLRWRRIQRPVVITGGELTLDMLELQYNRTGNFYAAPLHLKANGGVFLIDDFGRQLVTPRELLNRWIVPLEERIDFLTLSTGRKLAVPFEQLIIFSTNLNPRDLVDDAFLRRIRNRIRIDAPDEAAFLEIFRLACEERRLTFPQDLVKRLFHAHFGPARSPRSSDPRDLLQLAQSLCRFRQQPFLLTEDLLAETARRFFAEL
ncbi:MAG TPA: ATPase [Planctomycetaceae bacterium]|nr:ATPase [Planctomycetaceae bacterium]